jgi:hypothetical protein
VTTSAIRVTAAAASQLAVTTQPPSSVTVGQKFGLVVQALDAFGNPAASFNGSVTAILISSVPGATLGGKVSVTAVNGVATFSGLVLNKVGGPQTLKIRSGSLSAATTNPINVTPLASMTVGGPVVRA